LPEGVRVRSDTALPGIDADERVVLAQDGVLVSDRRLVADGRTFDVRQLRSATLLVESPSRKGPVVLIALGILGAALAIYGTFVLVVFGAAWAASQRKSYRVQLDCGPDGRAAILRSARRQQVEAVVAALSQVVPESR
jgi:Family of unknown function (DUF6232)